MPLKYENAAKVGDRIRSYDFQGRTDCFVEGTVQRIDRDGTEQGFAAFVVTVDNDGWPWRPDNVKVERVGASRVGRTVFVPMEVAHMEYDGRIVNLSSQ